MLFSFLPTLRGSNFVSVSSELSSLFLFGGQLWRNLPQGSVSYTTWNDTTQTLIVGDAQSILDYPVWTCTASSALAGELDEIAKTLVHEVNGSVRERCNVLYYWVGRANVRPKKRLEFRHALRPPPRRSIHSLNSNVDKPRCIACNSGIFSFHLSNIPSDVRHRQAGVWLSSWISKYSKTGPTVFEQCRQLLSHVSLDYRPTRLLD